ncbi:amidohydrolase family protein [Thalassotalea hakodatensis]|uniref:amidohydrolase family protein n=1 Tax=Thalassotalea hakodatensis TaxID=3030492 RepID=UPI002574066A|nr:amidohydrolase family protein [Thalassotalea hakodatensis]
MKLFKASLLTLALTSTASAYAESIAVTNATIHTMTEQGVLTNATVVFDEGVITAINPETVNADTSIDAGGKTLTPGFIGSMNQLGLVEVSAVSSTRDSSEKKANITFDASAAFNPKSTVIPYTRKGGITTNISVPRGGDDMFKGQAFFADLSGEFDSIRMTDVAVIVDLGAKRKGSRAMEIQKLRHKLQDTKEALSKAKKDKKDAKKPKRADQAINALLAGEKPMIAYVDRATDILALLALKKEFSLDLVIAGAGDAVSVADEIAQAEVPVIMGAINNLPSFDALHRTLASASTLFDAGVNVAYSVSGDTHNLYMLRFDAGISVANGVSKENALKAVTANVADAFNIDAGRIAVGKKADLVLWSGDPFELSTRVEQMWIDGVETSTLSRQDALRDRYTAETNMPRAYVK